MWWSLFYVLTIVLANVVTAGFSPVHMIWFIVPTGTFFIGFTLLFRNMVQLTLGRRWVYAAIFVGLVSSAISSYLLRQTMMIVVASAVSFAISESADTEIFTRMWKRNIYVRVLCGGGVGGILDSAVFVVLGLSPIGAGFIPWQALPNAILGQLLIKVLMQVLGGIWLSELHKRKKYSKVEVV